MEWRFFRVPCIPDIDLVKYQSLGEQGLDGVIERHNRFLRQWQRNTTLMHTVLHLFISYFRDRPKGNRIQVFLGFSAESFADSRQIDALMASSPLNDYYKLEYIDGIPTCLQEKFDHLTYIKKQERKRVSTGDALFTVEGWKSNPKARLYEMEKTMEALGEDIIYHISLYGFNAYDVALQALQKPISVLREKVLGRDGQIALSENRKNMPRDVAAEQTLRTYEDFLDDVGKSPCFSSNISLYANNATVAQLIMDSICGEAIKEGTCEIGTEVCGTSALENQGKITQYSNSLPSTLRFWPTTYTLEEITPLFRLPMLYDGENIEISKETSPKLDSEGIYLGKTNNHLDAFVGLSLLKKHAFICGVPGSGKTNTMLHLANSLWHNQRYEEGKLVPDPIPFLVLEPAKKEYRELANYDIPELIIFSPSASTKFPLRLNPFEFPRGLTLSEHIAQLCHVFEGAFPIAPPAPFILDKAIEGVYKDHGWNTGDINVGDKEYPVMSELYERFQKELSMTNYDSEIRGNIQSVLQMRIGSLLRREMKEIFDVRKSTFEPEQWLQKPIIVELESLGEGLANFVTLLLCTLIRETLKVGQQKDCRKQIRHIIFIEEAHNLIAPESQVPTGQDSNPKIAATGFIVKMLAEVRALREGIIIADQLPTAMAPEVIKNTNIKLVHRLTAMDDRQLICGTMAASGIQMEHVAIYQPGEALISYEGLQKPFELRIQEQKGHGSSAPNDDELYDIMIRKPAFCQLMKNEELSKWEHLKNDVKTLKKKEVDAIRALFGFDVTACTSMQTTDFFWQMENIYTGVCILRTQLQRQCCAINEKVIDKKRKEHLYEIISEIGETLQGNIKGIVSGLENSGQLQGN